MLVNINLLPQRKKKSISHLVLLVFSFFILFGGGIWLYFQYQSLQLELSTAQQQLTMTKKLREVQEQKANQTVASTAVSQLEGIIKWIEQKPVSTVLVLHHLVSALPKYGLFLNYQYTDEGTINISVQFDTLHEVSAYLHELESDPIIQEIKLGNVAASPMTPPTASVGTGELSIADEDKARFMPRYTAQFQIKLHVEKVKEEKGEAK